MKTGNIITDTMKKRNFKLWNHWIAEVRDIAKDNKVYFAETENENGQCKLMGKSHLKWYFGKDSMKEYFDEGMTPQEAFEEVISYWE